MPLPIVFESLTAFANTCFYTVVIPGELKVTNVIPIAKIPETKSLNDYRPISISAKLMLLLEKLLYYSIAIAIYAILQPITTIPSRKEYTLKVPVWI